MAVRKIVTIDEERCNGCGECIPNCAEGALEIVDGKARLTADRYCDGLGACLGHCPQDAISVEEREAEVFDEEAVAERQRQAKQGPQAHACPGAAMMSFAAPDYGAKAGGPLPSALSQWPVQLHLVPAGAPFLNGADLLLCADCVPFALPDLHSELLAGHKLLVGCPKLDDTRAYLEKLTDILRENDVRSLTVAHMEVPCCHGLVRLAQRAVQDCGKEVPLRSVEVSVRGQLSDSSA